MSWKTRKQDKQTQRMFDNVTKSLLDQGNGLKRGQEYPGDDKAVKVFKEIIDNDELKGWMLDKFKWKDEPKKIWKALTGRYYLLPIMGYVYGNESE